MRPVKSNVVFKLAAFTVLTIQAISPATAQSVQWPTKPIRLVIPHPPGGGPEGTIRAVADGLSQRLGQPVILDYKPGASGNIGAAETARSSPDGYTWMVAQETVYTVNPLIYNRVGYDIGKLMPVALLGSFVNVLACHPSVGVKSVKELVEKARSMPGKIRYASSGPGSPAHLSMAMFTSAADINLTHVPYRGPAPAVQDLLGGHVDCGFLVTSSVVDHIKNDRLVALGGSGVRPSNSLRNLPNLRDLGYQEVNATFWMSVIAPAGIDQGILGKFQDALKVTVSSAPVQQAMLATDTQPEFIDASHARERLAEVSGRWKKVIDKTGLKLD